ncbi:MAG: serine hydrolase domain-containing protein [Thermomicrobiales bacterium]
MTKAFSRIRHDRMRKVMTAHLNEGGIPGLVTLISHGGDEHVEAIGNQDLESGVPMQRDTIFRIASMTKPITAVAAMTLVEEYRLRLDDPVDRLLPELAERKVLRSLDGPIDDTVPSNRPLTLRDLMTFTSGYGIVMAPPGTYPIQQAIADLSLEPGPPHPASDPPPDEWMRRLGTLPLLHQPGARWLYNTGSDILGVLIARASGMGFGEFLRDCIFTPLGMVDTGFFVPSEKTDRLATSYEANADSGNLSVFDRASGGQWSAPPAFESGAGGLVSTADDLLAFGQMLLAKGVMRDGQERILSRPSVELMMTDQLTPPQKAASVPDKDIFALDGWGFGAEVTTRRTSLSSTPGQYGWAGGLGTSWAIDPIENLTGMLLTQVTMGSPSATAAMSDFWTTTYAALED